MRFLFFPSIYSFLRLVAAMFSCMLSFFFFNFYINGCAGSWPGSDDISSVEILGRLSRPSKNSCKIPQNNGGLVAAGAGEGEGAAGRVDLRQLRLCIRMAWSVCLE